MKTKLLYLFTRTPLHVGAGVSTGAIDHPLLRERHTGFPIIPGSTLKGVFADAWTDPIQGVRQPEGLWLFGVRSDHEGQASAGALQFSEAKLLALPVRSTRGSFAWITSPLILRRWARDARIYAPGAEAGSDHAVLPKLEPRDGQALFTRSGPLAMGDRIVLEEYTFTHAGELPGSSAPVAHPASGAASPPSSQPSSPATPSLGDRWRSLLNRDPVWSDIGQRLVVISDGMMSFFAHSACEVVAHASIDDVSGTAAREECYNQENVPAETMFYACVNCFAERTKNRPNQQSKTPDQVLADKVAAPNQVFQFGADASTGLGFCTIQLRDPAG